jgi:hypothetical protein
VDRVCNVILFVKDDCACGGMVIVFRKLQVGIEEKTQAGPESTSRTPSFGGSNLLPTP